MVVSLPYLACWEWNPRSDPTKSTSGLPGIVACYVQLVVNTTIPSAGGKHSLTRDLSGAWDEGTLSGLSGDINGRSDVSALDTEQTWKRLILISS